MLFNRADIEYLRGMYFCLRLITEASLRHGHVMQNSLGCNASIGCRIASNNPTGKFYSLSSDLICSHSYYLQSLAHVSKVM